MTNLVKMSDVYKMIEGHIIVSLRETFPQQCESIIPEIKVWWDKDIGFMTNAGMLLGKATKSKPEIVACILASKLRENPLFKNVYVT